MIWHIKSHLDTKTALRGFYRLIAALSLYSYYILYIYIYIISVLSICTKTLTLICAIFHIAIWTQTTIIISVRSKWNETYINKRKNLSCYLSIGNSRWRFESDFRTYEKWTKRRQQICWKCRLTKRKKYGILKAQTNKQTKHILGRK